MKTPMNSNKWDNDRDPKINIEEILAEHIEKPNNFYGAQYQETAEVKRKSLIILFLGIGIGGNILNWIIVKTLGWHIDELSFISATVLVMGLYFLLFPRKFEEHYAGKSNGILIIVLIISLIIGFANYYALKNGLY